LRQVGRQAARVIREGLRLQPCTDKTTRDGLRVVAGEVGIVHWRISWLQVGAPNVAARLSIV